MPLPKKLKSVLWSYDISRMDPKNSADKNLIIRQVLNYGDWEDLIWLFKNYSKKEIKNEIVLARRGIWHKKTLNYWLDIFQFKLPKIKYERSLFDLNPQPHLWLKKF